MKKHRVHGGILLLARRAVVLTTLGIGGVAAGANAVPEQQIARFIDAYVRSYTELGLGKEMELSYVKQIRALVEHTDAARERRALDALTRQYETLDLPATDPCQQLQLRQIEFELALERQKLNLLDAYLALGSKAVLSDAGLAQTTMGKQWYAYLRKAWLTMDTAPEDLMEMGRRELDQALLRYRALQARMGYAGRDVAFAAYLDGPAGRYPQGVTPQADYEARQAIIYRNLDRLFVPVTITPPQIRPSDLGAAFPVDGYYEPDQATFFYNNAKPRYDRRNIDWLLLHESTPGHHFQGRYALAQRACPVDLPHSFYSAYVEGWGAYVEQYGAELGLFKTASDELGAVEWNLVRSIRVVLDIGINNDGWSDEQARAYWRSALPMLPALAEREIARVRNWPAQAITYKLGAVMLGQLRDAEREREGAKFDIRPFHDRVLRNGPLPLDILAEIVAH